MNTLRETWIMGGIRQGPAASNYSHVQLFNPAGSNIFLRLIRIFLHIDTNNGIVQLKHSAAALSTLALAPVNMNNFGAPGVGVVRQENNVAKLGTIFCDIIGMDVNDKQQINLKPGFILNEGSGLTAAPNIVNTGLLCTFIWEEFAGS